jgi:hypothetical protein
VPPTLRTGRNGSFFAYLWGSAAATWLNGVESALVVTPNVIQVGAGMAVH